MSGQPAKILVVDDDESVRRSLERLLRSAGYVVETLASAEEFMDRGVHHDLGCLVLDIGMPGQSGLQLQKLLADDGCDVPIVFLTGQGDVPSSVGAMKRGAVDFLTKPVIDEDLLGAIRLALEKRVADLARKKDRAAAQERIASLTPREYEVMCHVIGGALNKQIADALGTGEKTIKVHRGNVMEKLGVESVAELVRLCAVAGVDPIHIRP